MRTSQSSSQSSGDQPSIFIPDALGNGSTILPAFGGVHNDPLPPPSAGELDGLSMVGQNSQTRTDVMSFEAILGSDYSFENLFGQPEPVAFDNSIPDLFSAPFNNMPRFDLEGFYPSPTSSSGSPPPTTPDSPITDTLPNSVGTIFEDLLSALQGVVSSQDISDLQDLLNAQHISAEVCLFGQFNKFY